MKKKRLPLLVHPSSFILHPSSFILHPSSFGDPVPTPTRKRTMAKLRKVHVPGENRLLVALPKDEYDRLLPHLEKVSLPLRDILYEADGPIAHVFFGINLLDSVTPHV